MCVTGFQGLGFGSFDGFLAANTSRRAFLKRARGWFLGFCCFSDFCSG